VQGYIIVDIVQPSKFYVIGGIWDYMFFNQRRLGA
jgi:hypothetical protein